MPFPTDGILFLISSYTTLIPAQLTTYALLTFNPTTSPLPLSIKYLTALLTSLAFVLLRRQLIALRTKRHAHQLGAELPPLLPYRKIGGLDLLKDMLHEAEYGYLASHLTSYFERMGHTFTIRIMGDDQILTIEPDYIKRVLATEFKNFEKGRRFREATQSVLGSGVFNTDDEMWKFHRTMTRPFFTRERISDFELFDRHAGVAINKLKERLSEGGRNGNGNQAVDFQDLVSRFTLDSATEFLFGSCVHSLSATLPYAHSSSSPSTPTPSATNQTPPPAHPSDTFAAAFASAQFAISQRSRIGYTWPLWELRSGDVTRGDMGVILGYVGPIVEEALRKRGEVRRGARGDHSNGGGGGGKEGRRGDAEKEKVERAEEGGMMKSVPEGETLLGHLVKETDDKKVITDETLNILIAGRDTTAALLTFTVYLLSQHPAVCARLREEVLEQVGPSRMPTYEDVRRMKFLRAVLNETLRLFPPVPFDVRSTREATVWPSKVPGGAPLYIPKDTPVVYSAFIMHRWKPFWGPDSLEFDPDRFIDERLGKYLTPNPFIFLPFNAGPRICLGQQFAYNESSFFLIRLLQSFSSFTLAPDSQPPDSHPPAEWKARSGRAAMEKIMMKSHLTMNVKGGLWLRMTEAKESEVA